MRTDSLFLDAYTSALQEIDPEAAEVRRADLRTLALSELCLTFLEWHLPAEDISAVPYLMLGYPGLLPAGTQAAAALASLRHLCGRFASVSAWVEACGIHEGLPETARCYAIRERRAHRLAGAPARMVALLRNTLASPVAWSESPVTIASPGAAKVAIDHGRGVLAFEVPAVLAERRQVDQHELRRRSENPTLNVSWDELIEAARMADEREALLDWPRSSLPALHLSTRLDAVGIEPVRSGFWDAANRTVSISGQTHIVGMLSSGKSTLVWGILFAVARRPRKFRAAVIASDTIQAAAIASRLRRHGVSATVLSSARNREKHLASIQWRHGMTAGGWALDSLGDLAEGFGTACPLAGHQRDLNLVRGIDTARWPTTSERPCHRLFQEGDPDQGRYEDELVEGSGRSCPLFAACPTQEQQRYTVSASVVVLTPWALVHMLPDRWTTGHRITFPELFQFTMDLVIIDEADSVQRTLDSIFAPRDAIMGAEPEVYAPMIGARTAEALRVGSGVQFRRAQNARWQSNFHTLFRLIGTLYALLQNEAVSLQPWFANTPFTGASVLSGLWRRKQGVAETEEGTAEYERALVDVLRVASSISRAQTTGAVAAEVEESGERDEDVADPSLRGAANALRGLAGRVLVSDFHADLIEPVAELLQHELGPFDISTMGGEAPPRRAVALAILLAVVSELLLAHYNWLVKAQPSVAQDFGIEDGQMFSQANNLLRHYRTLLPSNPAGGVYGLFYDEPAEDKKRQLGGKLSLINHLGVGRHLLLHMHDLLAAEGQTGPHVLMLSGTSWAGGRGTIADPRVGPSTDVASPCFDVQVPVQAVLVQPKREMEAIKRSHFALVRMRDGIGNQVSVSGQPPKHRPRVLAWLAQRFVAPRPEGNLLDCRWGQLERDWGTDDMSDRRRALLVVNSYPDAVVVADALAGALDPRDRRAWQVWCLVPDAEDESSPTAVRLARAVPRSLVERFGEVEEPAVLVAPLTVVSRGHNILNTHHRAAISSIYFLHRPHPRPDDLDVVIGRLNRLAASHFDGPESSMDVASAGRRLRREASRLVRTSLALRGSYSSLPRSFKAQFAWDFLTPLWQTIGRGIRGGCPVFVGFVDARFAPQSFKGATDTASTSVLVQVLRQLGRAIDVGTDLQEREVASRLYAPFYDALLRTEDLKHA